MIKALAFIHKIDGLSDVDFRDYYENKHAPLASSLLTLEGYERNYVNSELNPFYASLGSISIFQYQSMQSLEIVGKEMSSSAGDKLRNDELEFMDVSKNYHVLTESDQLTKNKFKKKIFYPFKNDEDLNLLDAYDGLEKISDNLLVEPNEIISISEYGITQGISLEILETLISEHPRAIIASCVN
ncbi:EthD domain-containing protein [Gammaproteobacteria bacterium]|nr:EthD domain-containing protein [Gammaproteobacteria bacterium]